MLDNFFYNLKIDKMIIESAKLSNSYAYKNTCKYFFRKKHGQKNIRKTVFDAKNNKFLCK